MTDLHSSAPFADTTLALMERAGVTLTPENYMVWYTHAAGRDPALSRLIDVYMSNGEPFTEERNLELYERFCGDGKQAEGIQAVGEKMGQTLGQIIGGVEENLQDTQAFGSMLSSLNDKIANSSEAEVMIDLVGKLRAETSFMHNRIRALEDRLSNGANEISDLKKQLTEVQREANTDALTMVSNRKRFDVELRSQAATAVETGDPLCLIMIDIDHFKNFNDTHGHQIGDLVLRLVARTLDLSTKGQDTVARYGGEEFAIILPETDIGNAYNLAERIRQKMAESRIRLKDHDRHLGKITVSAGVALYVPGEPLTHLIERADQCLYRAKEAGRNRVIATSEDEMAAAE